MITDRLYTPNGELYATVRRDGRRHDARVYSSTEMLAAADDAAGRWVREHYPEFAAAGAIPAGAYRPTEEEDTRP